MPSILGTCPRGSRSGRNTPPRRKRRPTGRSKRSPTNTPEIVFEPAAAVEPDFKRLLIYLLIIIIVGILWNVHFNKRKMESKAGADFNPPPEL